MFRAFNYVEQDESFNSVVEATLDLARLNGDAAKNGLPSDYAEKVKKLNYSIAKEILKDTRFEAQFEEKGLEVLKNPKVKKDETVQKNFNAILEQVTTAILPETVNNIFARFISEVHQVGWGETARFTVESNDLMKVNRKAEGVRKGVDQPIYNDEFTVNAEPIELSTHIDWYALATGTFDIGSWALRFSKSFSAYIFIKSIKAMIAHTGDYGAAYNINSVAADDFVELRDRVQAANGGMGCIAIGTASALANLELGGNFQVEIGEEMNKVGYLDQYQGVPTLALANVLVPGTTNTSATLVLPNNKIFLVPAAGQRPVKIVFEGMETSVEFNKDESSDKRYGITVELRVGIEVIVGPKYGTITL